MDRPAHSALTTIGFFRQQLETDGAAALARNLCDRALTHADDNIFINLDGHAFLAAFAETATQGVLSDIPFAVKDNIDALPFPTTGGCPALGEYRPEGDAPVVARIRAAGARMVGKTNMHELALGITSNNPAFGPVHNPFDRRRVAGGSSGGSAAAVARGIVPFALGTDTGGSVRIPAAFCNIVGFRPTVGRYPADGVLTLSPTRDTIGVMATCVADIASVDSVVTGEAPLAPVTGPLRLGILADARPRLSTAVDAVTTGALDTLTHAGVELVPIQSAALEAVDGRLGNVIALCEVETFWHGFAARTLGLSLVEFAEEIASPDVRDLFLRLEALAVSLRPDYQTAMHQGRPALQRAYTEAMNGHGVDAVLTVTVPVQPPLIGEDEMLRSDGATLPTFQTVTGHSALASVTGFPSLSLPAGLDMDGLPVGLQIEAAAGRDRVLLAIAARLERDLARGR